MATSTQHPATAQRPAETPVVVSEKARTVLAAARAVFLANGFSASTTDMIQQAAGVSKSTVYSHYPNKEALFTAVVEAECERALGTIREHRFTDGRLPENLTALAQAYLAIVVSPDGLALFRMVASEAPRIPGLGRRFYLAGPGAMNGIVAEILEAAMSNGEIDLRGVGRNTAASLFVSMVRGEAQMQCLTHPETPASAAQRDQWTNDAVTTFLQAFQKTKTGGRRS